MSFRIVNVKKLDPEAHIPEKKSVNAAAFDLYALEDIKLVPFAVIKVRTGIAVEIPDGFKGEVYTRSGYALKGISVVNQPGKIDSDYRGEVFVLLRYIPIDFWDYIKVGLFEPGGYKIKKGDRIAQFELQAVEHTVILEKKELSETKRGDGGLGSTGK
jgi:dUTP pyrophosphatase